MTVNDLHNHGAVWLPEEITQLTREFADDMDLEEIAALHGRTPYAIIGKLLERRLIVTYGDNYHRVEQDPWILGNEVKQLHRKYRS